MPTSFLGGAGVIFLVLCACATILRRPAVAKLAGSAGSLWTCICAIFEEERARARRVGGSTEGVVRSPRAPPPRPLGCCSRSTGPIRARSPCFAGYSRDDHRNGSSSRSRSAVGSQAFTSGALLFVLLLQWATGSGGTASAGAPTAGPGGTAPESDLERSSLNDLFKSTGGAQWSDRGGWGTNTSVCAWYGVTCDAEQRVTDLCVWSNNIAVCRAARCPRHCF